MTVATQRLPAFSYTTIPINGQRVRGVVATCGHCGVNGSVAVNSFRVGTSSERQTEFVRHKLEKKNWKIGNCQSQNLCPGCFWRVKAAAKRKKEEGLKMSDGSNVVKDRFIADKPREMSRDDGRVIFEKLSDVYDKESYIANWTDAKLATDLGVPRAWVERVRKEFFGPEGGNAEIAKALAVSEGFLGEAKKIGERASAVMNDIKDLLGKAERVEKLMKDIQGTLR